MLTEIGEARKQKCLAERCQYWRVSFDQATKRNTRWADFCAFSGNDPINWMELNPTCWEGPEGNCPARYWAGLQPVDYLTIQAEILQRKIEQQVAIYMPVVQEFHKTSTDKATREHLETLVVQGVLESEAKTSIEAELFTTEQIWP